MRERAQRAKAATARAPADGDKAAPPGQTPSGEGGGADAAGVSTDAQSGRANSANRSGAPGLDSDSGSTPAPDGADMPSTAPRQGAPNGQIREVTGVAANVKVIAFEEGLYAITVGSTVRKTSVQGIPTFPATHVVALEQPGRDSVKLFPTARNPGGWLAPEGGTLVAEAPVGGGHLIVTTYRDSATEPLPVAIQISRLNRPNPPATDRPASQARESERPSSATTPAPAASSTRDPKLELTVHVERLGGLKSDGGEWAGQTGLRRRIEAFSVRPLSQLNPADIEYKAFGPNGRETPWTPGDALCGAKGSGIPLTGFSIRLAERLRGRFEARYDGAFFEGGVSSCREGEVCKSPRHDDPLEAMKVSIVEVSPR